MTIVQTTTKTTTSWRSVARWAAIVGAAAYAIAMIAARTVIPPAVILIVVLLAGVALSNRPGRAGPRVTLAGGILLLLVSLTLASSDLSAPRSFPSWSVATAAAIAGVVLLISSIALVRSAAESNRARTIVGIAGVLIVLCVAVNLVGSLTNANASRSSADVAVTAKNTKFGPRAVSVRSGRVTFFLDNKDFQLHNFHIDGVGSAVVLTARHSVRHTFDLKAGTYRFECDFHNGMQGTLTVTG
jgi:plastocyanin